MSALISSSTFTAPMEPWRDPTHEPESSPARPARQRLQQSGYAALRRLRCENNDGVLVLSGRVSSYYLKQLAQTCVRDVEGCAEIVNNVQVDED